MFLASYLQKLELYQPTLLTEARKDTIFAAVGVYLAYFFGWRDDTASRLTFADIVVSDDHRTVVFSE